MPGDFRGLAQPFLPTPSARRATGENSEEALAYKISTHALREEGDKRRARRQR